MNTLKMQKTTVSLIIAVLFLTTISFKQASAANAVKDDKMNLITLSGSQFRSAQDALKDPKYRIDDATKDPEPPAKPKTNADKSSWDDYYKSYMEYINKLTDPAKRARAWGNLAADLLAMSKTNPNNISAATMNLVLSNLAEEYRKAYRGDQDAIKNPNALAGNIVSAAENLVNSGAFFKYTAAAQRAVISNFTALAVEITWRGDASIYNGKYANIASVFGKIMEKGNTNIKAHAFTNLMHLYRLSSWNNKAVIKKITEDAIRAAGGIDKLMNEFSKAFGSATGASKETLSRALGNMLFHNKMLNISSENVRKLVGLISGYIADINSGKTKASDGTKNSLIHLIGGYINQTISGGKIDEAANKKLFSDFVTFSRKALDSNNVALQASAINVLTALRNNAAKKGDKGSAAAIKKLFDGMTEAQIKKFVDGSDAIFKKNANKNRVAWLASALMNIAKYNIDNKTKKVSESQVIHILGQIGAWTSKSNNLKDMRNMSYQKKLFATLTALTKTIYTKNPEMAKNTKIADSICKIFSAVPDLKDEKVRSQITKMGGNLANSLRSKGFPAFAKRIEKTLGIVKIADVSNKDA
jgi:hypothetical protein